jgi:hypothetical protein
VTVHSMSLLGEGREIKSNDSVNSRSFFVVPLQNYNNSNKRNNVHRNIYSLSNGRGLDNDKHAPDDEYDGFGDEPNLSGHAAVAGTAINTVDSKRRNTRHYDEYLEEVDEDDVGDVKSHHPDDRTSNGNNDQKIQFHQDDNLFDENHRERHGYQRYSNEDEDDQGHDAGVYNEVCQGKRYDVVLSNVTV